MSEQPKEVPQKEECTKKEECCKKECPKFPGFHGFGPRCHGKMHKHKERKCECGEVIPKRKEGEPKIKVCPKCGKDLPKKHHGFGMRCHKMKKMMKFIWMMKMSRGKQFGPQFCGLRNPPSPKKEMQVHHYIHFGPPQPPMGMFGKFPMTPGFFRPPMGPRGFGKPPMGCFGKPPMGCFGKPPMGCFRRPPMGCFRRPPMGCFGRPPMGCFRRPPMGCFGRPPMGIPRFGRPPFGFPGFGRPLMGPFGKERPHTHHHHRKCEKPPCDLKKKEENKEEKKEEKKEEETKQ